MTWNLTLLPKSKKLVQFYFIVEAPTEMEIRGRPATSADDNKG
jgi:hypothetical protein